MCATACEPSLTCSAIRHPGPRRRPRVARTRQGRIRGKTWIGFACKQCYAGVSSVLLPMSLLIGKVHEKLAPLGRCL